MARGGKYALRGRSKFSAEEKARYKQQKIEESKLLVEQAVKELASQETWTNWIRFGRSNLRKYSFNNALLIWFQKRDAKLVHGFKQWLSEGVHVRDGATPIKIFAPVFARVKDEDGSIMYDESGVALKKVWFRIVTVFDVIDTDAPDTSDIQVMIQLEGNELEQYRAGLEGFARELGYLVRYTDYLGGAYGICDPTNSEIRILDTLPVNSQISTLVHELAHAYGDVNYQDYSREDAEVLVEAATIMSLGMLGFDTSKSSVPYIATWGEGDTTALKHYAKVIDDLVNKLTEKMGFDEKEVNE